MATFEVKENNGKWRIIDSPHRSNEKGIVVEWKNEKEKFYEWNKVRQTRDSIK